MSDANFSPSLGFVVVAFVGMCLVLVPTAFFFKLAWRHGAAGKLFVAAIAAMLATLLTAFTVSSQYPTDLESSVVIFIFTWGIVIWPLIAIFYFVVGAKTWLRQRNKPRKKLRNAES